MWWSRSADAHNPALPIPEDLVLAGMLTWKRSLPYPLFYGTQHRSTGELTNTAPYPGSEDAPAVRLSHCCLQA
jgi:hypothetical protein